VSRFWGYSFRYCSIPVRIARPKRPSVYKLVPGRSAVRTVVHLAGLPAHRRSAPGLEGLSGVAYPLWANMKG
jgi:hypothetical protein